MTDTPPHTGDRAVTALHRRAIANMSVHVLRLPHADYLQESNTNHVTAVAAGEAVLARDQTAASVSWTYHNPADARFAGPVTTPADLQHRIEDVLIQAAAGTGLLRLTLTGDRHLVVPAHHWPVFQVVVHRG